MRPENEGQAAKAGIGSATNTSDPLIRIPHHNEGHELMVLLARLAACGLISTSAGMGCLYAWQVGIQHSLPMALLTVLMALSLEASKPLAIKRIVQTSDSGASKREVFCSKFLLAILALVSVSYSLNSELMLVSMSRSDLVGERQAKIDNYGSLEAELRGIGFTYPVAYYDAKIDGLPKTKKNRDKLAQLKADKARATRRMELETRLKRLPIETGSIVVSDPGSKALSTYLALIGKHVSESTLSQLLVLIPVLALEAGSALALLLIPGGSIPAPRSVQEPVKPQEPERTSEAILSALREAGGSLDESERQLARRIGTSRTTARKALEALKGRGLIEIVSLPRLGTSVRLS